MNYKEKLQIFKELSKSGIVVLVLISVLAGYLIGQPTEIPLQWSSMLLTLLGVLCLASGSSALNQLQERKIDSQMARTSQRPLPSGRIHPQEALVFILVMLFLGLALLLFLNVSLLILGLIAVLCYNGLYTLWWKKNWSYAAVPGAIPGALPILMGHTSSTGQLLHPAGFYLFFLLFFWQMPHFWSLALKYEKDYAKGGFPTLPVTHGLGVTLQHIVIWCLAYLGLAFIAPLFLPVGWIYFFSTLIMSLKVIHELRKFIQDPESKRWLHFFLWINLSLIVFLAAASIDLWTIYLPIY